MRSALPLLVILAAVSAAAPAVAPYVPCQGPAWWGDGHPVGLYFPGAKGECSGHVRVFTCNGVYDLVYYCDWALEVDVSPIDKNTPCREAGALCPPILPPLPP